MTGGVGHRQLFCSVGITAFLLITLCAFISALDSYCLLYRSVIITNLLLLR